MMKKNKYGEDVFAGDDVYNIECTGDACIGDEVCFSRAIWSGNYPNATFIKNSLVEGRIINDSYGAAEQQHTFILQYENGKISKIMGRNLYENGLWRKKWPNEAARLMVLKNKHDRGREARAIRTHNIITRGEKATYKQKEIMTPDNIPQEQKFNPVIKDPKEVLRYACKRCGEMKAGTEYVWRRTQNPSRPLNRDPYCRNPCRTAILQDGLKKAVLARQAMKKSLQQQQGWGVEGEGVSKSITRIDYKNRIKGRHILAGQECIEQIEFIKASKNISYKAVATLIGVDIKSVMNWRHGRNLPRHELHDRIRGIYEEAKAQAAGHQTTISPPQPQTPMKLQKPTSAPQPPAPTPAEAGPSGWRCPSCRRVWAPHVDACKDCK